MASSFLHVFGDGTTTVVVEIGEDDREQLGTALEAAGVAAGRPVLVVVGGAGGMDDADLRRLRPTFAEIVELLDDMDAAAVDGGTDTGAMRLLGQVRLRAGASFPLVGVAARGTVVVGDRPHGANAAELAPGHSHLLLVPGSAWGDEAPWIAQVATALAAPASAMAAGSVTLLVNGGAIAYDDARHSHRHGREVVVVAGSGRTADELAAAVRGDSDADARAHDLVAGGPVASAPLDDPAAVVDALRSRLHPSS